MKNIANYISISRIIMSIMLLIPKTFSISFYCIYIYCGISDMLDGIIARKLKITSKFGEKIDSISDFIFIIICLIKFIPNLNLSNIIYLWIILIAIIKLINIICGYIYYKKLILLHTLGNKITGFALFIYPLFMQFSKIEIIEIIICVIATFSAIQEGHFIRTNKIDK